MGKFPVALSITGKELLACDLIIAQVKLVVMSNRYCRPFGQTQQITGLAGGLFFILPPGPTQNRHIF